MILLINKYLTCLWNSIRVWLKKLSIVGVYVSTYMNIILACTILVDGYISQDIDIEMPNQLSGHMLWTYGWTDQALDIAIMLLILSTQPLRRIHNLYILSLDLRSSHVFEMWIDLLRGCQTFHHNLVVMKVVFRVFSWSMLWGMVNQDVIFPL